MRVLIRADGHHRLGGGHVMRQLGLAQALLRSGHEVQLVSAMLDPALEAEVTGRRVPITRVEAPAASQADTQALAELAGAVRADWVVLDHYDFSAQQVEELAATGARVLVIDDFLNRAAYRGHLLLNQNADPSYAETYRERGFGGRLLLGPGFALLRPEFTEGPTPSERVAERADRLLVTMGSADSVRATELALSAVAIIQDPALRIDVVVGPANPRGQALRTEFPDSRLSWHEPAADMAALLRGADLVIGAAGVTTLELSCVGAPALLMVLADNQELLARITEASGAALCLGWYTALEPSALADRIQAVRADRELRAAMRRAGRRSVDGRGAERVVRAMEEVPR